MNFYSYNVFPMGNGWIGLLGSHKGLRRLSFQPTPGEALEGLEPELADADEDPAAFPNVRSCLERYFEGDVQALDSIDLDMTDAPDFYRAAWTACREIPPERPGAIPGWPKPRETREQPAPPDRRWPRTATP